VSAELQEEEEPELSAESFECACCTQEIETTEDVLFLLIVQARNIQEKIGFFPVLKDRDGDYQFSPQLVHHHGCWSEIANDLREKVQDRPPVEDASAVTSCTFCASGILESEYFAFGQVGEFYCSPHMPHNKPTHTFVPYADYENVRICLSCVAKVAEEMISDLEEVSQLGECICCTDARCWRSPSCTCPCHAEDNYN
jgi:hypothetical protein